MEDEEDEEELQGEEDGGQPTATAGVAGAVAAALSTPPRKPLTCTAAGAGGGMGGRWADEVEDAELEAVAGGASTSISAGAGEHGQRAAATAAGKLDQRPHACCYCLMHAATASFVLLRPPVSWALRPLS